MFEPRTAHSQNYGITRENTGADAVPHSHSLDYQADPQAGARHLAYFAPNRCSARSLRSRQGVACGAKSSAANAAGASSAFCK